MRGSPPPESDGHGRVSTLNHGLQPLPDLRGVRPLTSDPLLTLRAETQHLTVLVWDQRGNAVPPNQSVNIQKIHILNPSEEY